MERKTKNLKRAIMTILVLVLFLLSFVAVSAVDSYTTGQKYTYNGTEYVAERPADATVTTHVYYVGGATGSDSNDGSTKETPFATIAGAMKYAQNEGYLVDVNYSTTELHEVKLVLVGDTVETSICPQMKGGILTIVPDDGVNATVTIGTSSTTVSGNFIFMKPNSKSSGKYMEVNLGAPDMNGTITFDGTYYNINAPSGSNTKWGGFLRMGDESYKDVAIANMYDGITVCNIGYNEETGQVVAKRNGYVIHVDCGTFNMYGGKLTQNICDAIITSYGRSGAGAYIYSGEITNNNAGALSTLWSKNARIVVYDCLIDNNVAAGWGAIDCSYTGSTMLIYGGTISNNIGTGNSKNKQICANGNFYISDNVTVDDGVCNTLDGKQLTVAGTYECNNHFDMVSTVIYAKDGSAIAYGYYDKKTLYFKDGDAIENFDGCSIALTSDDYVYLKAETNSCLYYVNINTIDISEMMTSEVYYFGEELAHKYELVDSKDATDTEAGYQKYTCSDCGDSYEVIFEPTGCEHDYEITDVASTCTERGYKIKRCKICGFEMQYDFVAELGHDYITDILKATCLADGYIDVTCSRCDYHTHEAITILEHSYELEKTYPSLLYRCVNGCNQKIEKTYITYRKNLNNWASVDAKEFTLQNSDVRYTVEVEIGQKITVGQTLDGADIAHQNDSGSQKFFGWYTEQGEVFEYGDEITVEGNMVFYEAYGYEIDSSNYKDYFYKGWRFLRLTSDLEPTSTLGFDGGTAGLGVIDLNGHNITFKSATEGEQYNNKAFSSNRHGVILIGEGVITHNASDTNKEFMYTGFHGYGDGSKDTLIHTLWIGKNVTVNTTGPLFFYQSINTTPIIKIAGTVNVKSLCNVKGATVEIYPSANITFTDSTKLATTADLPVQVNVYGGDINLPEGIADISAYLVPNAKLYQYQISGGTFNVSIPDNLIYMECALYHDEIIAPEYIVILKCTNGTHVFEKHSTDTICGEYLCSCGISIGGTIGHLFDTVTSIAYPNGFDSKGDNRYGCMVCQIWNKVEEGVAEPIFVALGYSVNGDHTSIYGGFTVNIDALNAYNSYLGEGKGLRYGIIISNVTDLEGINFDEKGIDNERSVTVEITDKEFARFGFSINNFSEVTRALKLVISAYVIDENGNVSFIQKDGAMDGSYYVSGISANGVENALGVMTLQQVIALTPAQAPATEPSEINKENVA